MRQLNFDFGYNFWGRSCEDIACPNDCNPCSQSLCSINGQNTWALKGDARMFGYHNVSGVPTAVALSSSESNADIHLGTNDGSQGAAACSTLTNARLQNCGVDNAGLAVVEGVPFAALTYLPGATADATNVINSSFPPVFINCDDIDLQATRGISNTVFANVSHGWERDTRTMFLGIGASAEFGKAPSCCDNDNDCGEDSCESCINSAVSQWTVWLKGGVSFN